MKALCFNLFAGLVAVALCAAVPSAWAQDLYDTTVLRTFSITFHDANWLTLLRQNYPSQTNILADLEVDSIIYPDVGVRIRGNTSYVALPRVRRSSLSTSSSISSIRTRTCWVTRPST